MEKTRKTSENFCEFPNRKNRLKKSKSTKAAGLKSTFVVNDKLLVTSFGKRNEAVFEKSVENEIISLNNPENFSMERAGKKFSVISKRNEGNPGLPDNPLMSIKEAGEDVIGCKDILEKEYFGKHFSDNIHIQLIYNILDIKKILAVHINNIIYEFDNLMRNDTHSDFIGNLSTRNTYENYINPSPTLSEHVRKSIEKSREYFINLSKNPRLKYFGEIFYKPVNFKDKRNKKTVVDEKKLYYILAMLGDIRQFCFHANTNKNVSLYNLEKTLKYEAKNILDIIYSKKINELNRSFLKTNAKNIEILFAVLKPEESEKTTIIKDFYNFIIRKQNKNMGFSLKKLREQMIDENCEIIKDKRYDSVRSKFYRLLDFIIFEYYKNAPEKADYSVLYLRSCNSDEKKDLFYLKEANKLWNDIKNKCEALREKMKQSEIGKAASDTLISETMQKSIDEIKISSDSDYFGKLIYLLTHFIDGKEINDLLTTLINKFENIASLYSVMKGLKLECDFSENYKFFEKSESISADLRVINSFARMTHKESDAKKIMYLEAAELLGFEATPKEIDEYVEKYLLNDQFKKGQHDFRNFIASNVISSSRFKYLIRYANPKKIRKIAKNEKVVRFVLERIGKLNTNQLEKYYKSCFGSECNDKEKIISSLTDIILKMDFKEFSKVKQNDRKSSPEEKSFKAKKQAAISLYLTVLYHFVKNIINVNSRYTIAFHCLERDMQLYGMKLKVPKNSTEKASKYRDLTEKLINEKKENIEKWFNSLENSSWNQRKRKWRLERSCEYLSVNLKNSHNTLIVRYRNNIEHLDVISNIDKYIGDIKEFKSYFELYHYIVQRKLIDECRATDPVKMAKLHENIEKFAEPVLSYNTYCKDFVKALNIPFGYNLARFKNLSINELFDMNEKNENENQ